MDEGLQERSCDGNREITYIEKRRASALRFCCTPTYQPHRFGATGRIRDSLIDISHRSVVLWVVQENQLTTTGKEGFYYDEEEKDRISNKRDSSLHSCAVCGGSLQRNYKGRKGCSSSDRDCGCINITDNRAYPHHYHSPNNDSTRDHGCGNYDGHHCRASDYNSRVLFNYRARTL